MSETIKLSIEDMNLHYGTFHALKDINMHIPEKENHCVHRPQRLRQIHFF